MKYSEYLSLFVSVIAIFSASQFIQYKLRNSAIDTISHIDTKNGTIVFAHSKLIAVTYIESELTIQLFLASNLNIECNLDTIENYNKIKVITEEAMYNKIK